MEDKISWRMMESHADEDAFQKTQNELSKRGIFRRCGNDPCYAPNQDGEGCDRCGLRRPQYKEIPSQKYIDEAKMVITKNRKYIDDLVADRRRQEIKMYHVLLIACVALLATLIMWMA